MIHLGIYQRWSPREHILKSLASKVKSLALASKSQVLENCPLLGSSTALFFVLLKSCWKTPETLQKICEDLFCFPQLEVARKIPLLVLLMGSGASESATVR